MVADEFSRLFRGHGIGARLVLSSVIVRIDLANGAEGAQSLIGITYPWSMFSVDNPGDAF